MHFEPSKRHKTGLSEWSIMDGLKVKSGQAPDLFGHTVLPSSSRTVHFESGVFFRRVYLQNNTIFSEIFCHGPFLDHMQKLELDQVEESKYFVDMKLKYPEQKTLEDFNTLTDEKKNDREFMSNWLNDYFDPPGSEFQNHQFDQVKFHYR